MISSHFLTSLEVACFNLDEISRRLDFLASRDAFESFLDLAAASRACLADSVFSMISVAISRLS